MVLASSWLRLDDPDAPVPGRCERCGNVMNYGSIKVMIRQWRVSGIGLCWHCLEYDAVAWEAPVILD